MTPNYSTTAGVNATMDIKDNGYSTTVPVGVGTAAGNAFTPSGGTAITFDRSRVYGLTTAETGAISISTALPFVSGVTQLLIHNAGAEPSYGSGITKISGSYTINVPNYIMLMAVSPTLVLMSINQGI